MQQYNKFNVYGCFCSPECACAYLIDEKINDSENLNATVFLTICMAIFIIILKICLHPIHIIHFLSLWVI